MLIEKKRTKEGRSITVTSHVTVHGELKRKKLGKRAMVGINSSEAVRDGSFMAKQSRPNARF